MAPQLIAVTGAGGFIGRSVVATLQNSGADVVGLVGPDSQTADRLAEPPGPGRWEWGAVDDPTAADRLLDGAVAMIHLAGPPSVGQSFARPAEYVAAHTAGTANLLQAAARGGVRRVVVVSSAEIYGTPAADVVVEDHDARPLSPYAVAKLASEGIAEVLARTHGLEAVVVRPFAVYGPASPPWSLVGTAVDQALQPDGAPVLMSDLDRVRDLTYVEDVADLLTLAATTPIDDLAGRIIAINAATGRGTSVLELARSALAAAGREAEIVERPARPEPTSLDVLGGARPAWSDPIRLVGSCERAGRLLGWVPQTDVDAGLRSVVAARRQLGR